MRIYSKATLQFDHPTGAEPSVVARVGVFADVPDWVKKSGMFILASKDGTVTEIENKKDESKAEKAGGKQKPEKNGKTKEDNSEAPEGGAGDPGNAGDPEGDGGAGGES
ncbi:hypothetical protein [Paenibacillus ginsengarvi]|uniref:Uncharacterized protein n=1 Tax=Paenibacillus ginsengarvi TaxID=400777 RepID=A0A3B0BSM0_9BACL|nr:hypothetical protein [Paenibacillus ginsengarvi]RKN75007.1 hypothetical protein D7M11_26075 [Paenibacillus ginsengarvi]